MTSKPRTTAGRLATLERYELLFKIGSGGAATVYLGRRLGPEGFSRLVAVKRAHPHLQGDPADRRARLREASVASRLHHANVVATQDVELSEQDLLLVMDYVEGASLSDLLEVTAASPEPAPLPIVMRIALDACAGLRAVHELTDEHGRALSAMHRDISPQNILVGTDGLARISDFGLAKLAEAASHTTGTWRTGSMAGKLAYLAPEVVQAEAYDARCDIFSLGVVLWEAIASRRLFGRSSDPTTAERIVKDAAPDLSRIDSRVPVELARVVARALEKRPEDRWDSARLLAEALQELVHHGAPAASRDALGAWVAETAAEALTERRDLIRQCTEDAAGRPSIDFAFAGTASMVGDGLLPAADDAPTPQRAELVLDDAVSRADVTEGSVTALVPIVPASSETPEDDEEPVDELTASERETIAPPASAPAPASASAPAPASAPSASTPRRWRVATVVAAFGLALIAGVSWVWSSSAVASRSGDQDRPVRLGADEVAETDRAENPAGSARSRPAEIEDDVAPSMVDRSAEPADAMAGDPRGVLEQGDDVARPDAEDSSDPYEGPVTIDLDEPASGAKATPRDPPRAHAPKPPANPYRR